MSDRERWLREELDKIAGMFHSVMEGLEEAEERGERVFHLLSPEVKEYWKEVR